MKESPQKQDELFHLISRFLGEEESWMGRLVSSHEIVVRLLQSREARAVIGLARQHKPDESAEQWLSNIVASFGQAAAAPGSEWQNLVEALQVNGEWFFRSNPPPIASHLSVQTST